MRNDERLRTIYEVMAPYIVRNEHNWRDYLAFASQFHKHSFDNILLVYAQDEDVSILATRKQWATIGRNLIPRAKGVAVCVYRNAKLTLDYLFDVSQTTGKEIHPTDWQLSDEMKKALTERLSYAHGFPKQDFPQALYAMASESVAENYNHFLQELKQETKGHLFTEIPAGGFEAQYIQLLTDSISYFIGKKCHLSDEEIQLSDGMATVSHFNTLPLVAHLGTAVTALSKGILLEVERNIKIINRERMAQHEQTEYQSEIQGAGRDDASRSANLQQQRSRSTSGQVRPDGPGIPQRESPGAIYDFENPLTAKILAKVAVQAATDSESRKRILFMILAPVLGLLLLIAFILYLITSPFSVLSQWLIGDEVNVVEDFQKQYGYNQQLGIYEKDYIDGSGQSYEGIIFTDGVTEVVYYNQLDERWADLPYGTDNIGGYGCGPTSMAIVVSSLTDQTVDLPTMAEWAYQNGYWCSGNGSYHSLIPGAAEGFGLQWESISTDDPQAVVDTLASGKLIVALMSKGHFTSSGHFMVLRGVTSEGKILVADPASKKRSEQEWDISIILDEARKGAAAGGPLWAIY